MPSSHAKLTFVGGTDPMVADPWITDMEYQFQFMEVTYSVVQSCMAPATFQGDVVAWWKREDDPDWQCGA